MLNLDLSQAKNHEFVIRYTFFPSFIYEFICVCDAKTVGTFFASSIVWNIDKLVLFKVDYYHDNGHNLIDIR